MLKASARKVDLRWRLLLVLLLGVVLSSALAHQVQKREQHVDRQYFDAQAQGALAGVLAQLQRCEALLRSNAALFEASDTVTASEWQRYASDIELSAKSEVENLSFAKWTGSTQGVTGSDQGDALRVLYRLPAAGDALSVGSNLLSDPQQRDAVLRARDTGAPTLTAPMPTTASSVARLALYLPVYRRGMPIETPEQRRAAIDGVVGTSIRIGDLIRDSVTRRFPYIQVQIRDLAANAAPLVYAQAAPHIETLQLEYRRSLYGRVWQLDFSALPDFGSNGIHWMPVVLSSGLALTLLLLTLVYGIQRTTRTAAQVAGSMTQAFRDAEAQQQAIVASSAEGILTIDLKGTVLSFNHAAERMFGYAADDVVGRNVSMLMPERYRARHDHLVASFNPINNGRIVGLRREVTGQRHDGSEFPMMLSINVIDAVGSRRFVGVISDISERKSAELALCDSEAEQRAIVSSSAEGILTIDAKGTVLSFNRAAERMFGYSAAEVVHRNVSMLMPMRYRARHDHLVDSFNPVDHGRIIGLRREVTGLRRDGNEFPMTLSINIIEGVDGRRFVGVISDISERKEAERALRDSEERLRIMVESVSDYAIIMLDTNGNVSTWNTGATKIHGYTPEEAIGKHISCFYAPEDVAQGKPEQHLQIAERHGRVEDDGWRLRKDGSHFWVNMVIAAIRDPAGRLVGYSKVWRDITERKQYEAHIQHIAHHDALTGLANRVLMEDRLHQALLAAQRAQTKVAVFMIDVDHFKRINDSLGHHVGDQILLAVSHRLQAELRSSDTVARMGGDEFVALLVSVNGVVDATRTAAKLVAAFERPFNIGQHELHLTASIGISIGPDDGRDVPALLMTADAAMYKAKAAGRGCFRVFSEDMRREANRKLDMENAIRHALLAQQFQMHYEPQIDLRSGRVVGMEALIRWLHPQRGWITPGEFIPVAEETGLIVQVGEWTLRTACQEAREIQQRTGLPLTVAINISPRQFLQRDLVEKVHAACVEAQLDPHQLMVEITESCLVQDAEEALRILSQLRSKGVRVSIDDFGTGYSSLSYITRFPVDQLKIDRSFVRDVCSDPADAAIAQAIIAMAHSLDIHVVAEGIETIEQLEHLQRFQCDSGQGFYFGRGTTADGFVAQGHHLARNMPEMVATASAPLF